MNDSQPHWHVAASRRAVDRLRDVILAGGFEALAAVDPSTGELVSSEARALFAALPSVTPATSPDELVEQGLLKAAPRQLREVYEQPKYFRGRQVFVATTVAHESADKQRPGGRFDASGPVAITHLAELDARQGDSVYVQVEDAPRSLAFPLRELLAWNEPCGAGVQGGKLYGLEVDYSEPLFKAHICAALIELDPEISALDFSAPGALEAQKRVVHRLASRLRFDFSGRGEGYRGVRAGALLSGGQASSFIQSALAGAVLQAFSRVLALEVQIVLGSTLRLRAPHGFVVVALRPSMERFVVDPAWGEPLTDLRIAFFGPGWGHDRRVLSFEGESVLAVGPAEIDLPNLDPAAEGTA